MKKTDYDKSDVMLFVVLAFFLITVFGALTIALFTLAINTLLVLFSVDMVPFSLFQGLLIWASVWVITWAIRPPNVRRDK